MKSAKGGDYEREMCKRLSLWWTDGKRDDVFWRSASSGGRATSRSKKGKKTAGSYGDITAVDVEGAPLIEAFTIELKRGYSASSFADALDRRDNQGASLWENFVEQASRSAREARTPYWLLIHRRDQKKALVFMPTAAWKDLAREAGQEGVCPGTPYGTFRAKLRTIDPPAEARTSVTFMALDVFLEVVKAEHVKALV